MKNLVENYYAWEQVQERQFEKLRRLACAKASLFAFLLFKIARASIVLLFLSDSRMIRFKDESARLYEDVF